MVIKSDVIQVHMHILEFTISFVMQIGREGGKENKIKIEIERKPIRIEGERKILSENQFEI